MDFDEIAEKAGIYAAEYKMHSNKDACTEDVQIAYETGGRMVLAAIQAKLKEIIPACIGCIAADTKALRAILGLKEDLGPL